MTCGLASRARAPARDPQGPSRSKQPHAVGQLCTCGGSYGLRVKASVPVVPARPWCQTLWGPSSHPLARPRISLLRPPCAPHFRATQGSAQEGPLEPPPSRPLPSIQVCLVHRLWSVPDVEGRCESSVPLGVSICPHEPREPGKKQRPQAAGHTACAQVGSGCPTPPRPFTPPPLCRLSGQRARGQDPEGLWSA